MTTMPALMAFAKDEVNWAEKIREHYRHYRTIEVMSSGLRSFSPCGDEREKRSRRAHREKRDLALHHLRHAAVHLFLRHLLDERADRPLVAARILYRR